MQITLQMKKEVVQIIFNFFMIFNTTTQILRFKKRERRAQKPNAEVFQEHWAFINKYYYYTSQLHIDLFIVVVQSLSCIQLFETPQRTAHKVPLSFTVSLSLLKLMSFESMMPFNHLILCCPLLLLPSIFPSIRLFSSKLALCIRWLKYWSFSFSISPSNEYSGLISFRINWFDLLAVKGTLKSLL